jgi:biotin carboxylase
MTEQRPVLLVGYSSTLLAEFGRLVPEGGLVIVEEPDAVRKRGAAAAADAAPACRELVEEEFLLPGGADRFYLKRRELDPVAVIPAHEYAVPAAARIAERYGVPGPGLGAALALRDKHLLRSVAAAAGIGNPVSRLVADADEVAAFYAEFGGKVIIKPTNRQASLGMRTVTDAASIPATWAECIDQDAEAVLPDRPQELRMLVEEFVEGPEYSVELLYSNGNLVFGNATEQLHFPGIYPVEQGHLVPAPIPAELTELLIGETVRLLDAVGFGVGMVHCEWIVNGGRPYLVECAGRQPGDYILELIEGAYQFDLYAAYLDLMSGRLPDVPRAPVAGAATWYRTDDPGEVVSVDGVEVAAELPGVKTCAALVEPGKRVNPLRNAWDRTAVVTVHAGSATEAHAVAQKATDLIEITTKPADDLGSCR